MSRALALLIIGLVFGGGIGFVIAAANGVTLDGHDHATDHGPVQDHAQHDHSQTVEAEGPAPTLMIHVTKDPVAGWNLHVMTTNFVFAPERSGASHVPGEGHAHLYANGTKIARLYGPWFHIDSLPAGEVEIEVTLNTNDHSGIAVDGTPVRESMTLNTAD